VPLAERFRQTGIYLMIGDPTIRTSIVSTDDLARIATLSATTEGAMNQTFAVGGPEILERSDIPKIFSRIFNRESVILNPPLAAVDGVRSLLGLFNPSISAALGTFRTLLANEFYCTPAAVQRLEAAYGFSLESLEAFLRCYFSV
jgi:uncharacterized protein YbjT (DUF2867 family)